MALDVAAALLSVRLACEDKLERDQRGGVILSDLVALHGEAGLVAGSWASQRFEEADCGTGYVQAAVRRE